MLFYLGMTCILLCLVNLYNRLFYLVFYLALLNKANALITTKPVVFVIPPIKKLLHQNYFQPNRNQIKMLLL